MENHNLWDLARNRVTPSLSDKWQANECTNYMYSWRADINAPNTKQQMIPLIYERCTQIIYLILVLKHQVLTFENYKLDHNLVSHSKNCHICYFKIMKKSTWTQILKRRFSPKLVISKCTGCHPTAYQSIIKASPQMQNTIYSHKDSWFKLLDSGMKYEYQNPRWIKYPQRSCIATPLQFKCAFSILVVKFESFPNTNLFLQWPVQLKNLFEYVGSMY